MVRPFAKVERAAVRREIDMIRRTALLAISALSVIVTTDNDVQLRCVGEIIARGDVDWHKNEVIAMHTHDGTVTFSGNRFLRGNMLTICPGPTEDDIYFDSGGCGDKKTNPEDRQYGTYNRILHTLDLTNTMDQPGPYILIQGTFQCDK